MDLSSHDPVGGFEPIRHLFAAMFPLRASPADSEIWQLLHALHTLAIESNALQARILEPLDRSVHVDPLSPQESAWFVARLQLMCQVLAQALSAAHLDDGSWTATPNLTDALTRDIPDDAVFRVHWHITAEEWQRCHDMLHEHVEHRPPTDGKGVFYHGLRGPAALTYDDQEFFERGLLYRTEYLASDEEWERHFRVVGVDPPSRMDAATHAALPLLDVSREYYLACVWRMLYRLLATTTLAARSGVGSYADEGFHFPGTFHFQWNADVVIVRNYQHAERELVVRSDAFITGARTFVEEFALAVRKHLPAALDAEIFHEMRDYLTQHDLGA